MVEHYNTGVLLHTKKGGALKGIWISPDGKKQLEVNLSKTKISTQKIEQLEDKLEQENYNANDC